MTLYMITAAKGPLECQYATYLLWQKLQKHSVKLIDETLGEEKETLRSLIFESEDDNILQPWLGTHQFIFPSPYRKNHKRKNWFIGLFALPDIDENPFFDKKDVEIKAVRASGPGGQHVNKTSTAIQAKHKPSNLTIFVQEQRSQHQNKQLAYLRLMEKIAEKSEQNKNENKQKQWEAHFELVRGSPVKIWR